jgi:pyruvate/2-oxoglutarate/acetoin dehydrogenase E1 component
MSMTYLEAIREAQYEALRTNPGVFLYGQDIAAFGGAFKATKNLSKEFPGRVFDAPISEDAMVGLAVGAAIEGARPIIEMQFADFSTCGFNQIVNQAATLFWRTNTTCPITIRLPSGGTAGSGPFHSQSMESLYAHYPGLVILTPASVEDAYWMLLDAVALDDPVIFCEHKFLYYHLKADQLGERTLPIGKARIVRPGRHATVVTYSAMVHESVRAAEELQKDGYQIEVGRSAVGEADGHRYDPCFGRTNRSHFMRRRGFPLGWRNCRSGGSRFRRGFPSSRCAADASERQRHTDPVSPQSLEGAPSDQFQHR